MQGYAHLAQEDRRHIEMMRKEGFWETCAVGFSRGVRVKQRRCEVLQSGKEVLRLWVGCRVLTCRCFSPCPASRA